MPGLTRRHIGKSISEMEPVLLGLVRYRKAVVTVRHSTASFVVFYSRTCVSDAFLAHRTSSTA
jgi:hypothetical protein